MRLYLVKIMKPLLFTFVMLTWPILCAAQGTLTITFDGPPLQPDPSQYLIQQYSESGVYFEPLPESGGFLRNNNVDGTPLYPNDGSTYLQAGYGEGLEFNFGNGSLFGLASVDLAAYGINQANFTVDFVGYHADGGTITTSFSGTGIDFQTYYFGSDWSAGLTRVEIPNAPWSLDNLIVTVPEPSSCALFALGGVTFLLNKRQSI